MKQFVLIYLNNLSYDNIIQLLKACVYNDIVFIKYVCVLILYLVEIIYISQFHNQCKSMLPPLYSHFYLYIYF